MLKALLVTMRPKQWAKNVFLFAGLVFDRQLTNLPALLHVIEAFLLFSLLSSTVYVINDLIDLEADRKHPKKRNRPLPSGKLQKWVAMAAAVIFFVVVFVFAYPLSPLFAALALTYFLLNLAYTFWLKHVPLLDVIVLASFYVIRVAAGVVVIDVQRFSPWLYVFTIFLALFLGTGKRRAELVMLAEDANNHRRVLEGYTIPFLDQIITIVLTLSVFTYSFYTFSAPNLPDNNVMMVTIPFVLYGVFRYLYLVNVQGSGDAPEDILFHDRPLQATIALWAVVILLIFYKF